jgi:hypothetical protein
VQPRVRSALVSRPWLHAALDGTWLGAPPHPALTDAPVGSWTAAFGIDLVSTLTGSHAIRNAADGPLALRNAGRALSAVGLAFSGTAAHLGGLLSFGLGVRVNQDFSAARTRQFTPVLDDADLTSDAVKVVQVDGTPVLLARGAAGQIYAIANTSSQLGGPLGEGEREGDIVTCGSTPA